MFRVSFPNKFLCVLFWLMVLGTVSCTSASWETRSAAAQDGETRASLAPVFEPDPEDVPFFRAIADEQDLQLQSCKNSLDCQHFHFLRALASLYTDPPLAAPHFRKVVTAKPTSRLASESRFWLWFLEVLASEDAQPLSTIDVMRRLTREIVDREFIVHELASKLEHSSIENLQQEVSDREKKVEERNQVIAALTKQVDQLKKEPVLRQSLQKELKASEKKVEELMSQLEALRRIDQELKEKAPPTRPSEKMTPSTELKTEPKK